MKTKRILENRNASNRGTNHAVAQCKCYFDLKVGSRYTIDLRNKNKRLPISCRFYPILLHRLWYASLVILRIVFPMQSLSPSLFLLMYMYIYIISILSAFVYENNFFIPTPTPEIHIFLGSLTRVDTRRKGQTPDY